MFIWLRGTLPRMRYDQFMRLGWKALVPVSLLWILTIFAIRTYRNSEGGDVPALLMTLGIVLAVVLVVAFLVPDRREPTEPGRAGLGLPGAAAGPRGAHPPPQAARGSRPGGRSAANR